MAQPPRYRVSNDDPAEDFGDIQETLDALLDNLALLQRDDGELKNAIVKPDSLSTATKALIAGDWNPRGAWVTNTEYEVGDMVVSSGATYVCAVRHVSDNFGIDLAALRWMALADAISIAQLTSITGASLVAATDKLPVYDDSASETKGITLASFADWIIQTYAGFTASGSGLSATTVAAQLKKSEFFDSISALRSWSAPTVSCTAFVRGYYNPGDGGGGMYYWDSDATDTENGGTIIKATGITTGRWKRYFDHYQFSIKVFGAVGDGGAHPLSGYFVTLAAAQAVYPHAAALTDEVDGIAWQAAMDACDTYVSSGGGRQPTVILPCGEYETDSQYVVNTELTWEHCSIVGGGEGITVQVIWNGTAGDTLLTKVLGSATRGKLKNIHFIDGTARPGTWVDLSPAMVDHQFTIEDVQFEGSNSDAIKIGQYVNLHFRRIRWDSTGGYAIRVTISSAVTPERFCIEDFAYDHSRDGDGAPGFILFDNSSANLGNLNVISIREGTFEVSTASGQTAPWASPQAVLHYKTSNTPAGSAFMPYMQNLFFSGDAGDGVAAYWIYRDTTDTTIADGFMMDNVRHPSGITAVIGGTWHASFPTPTDPSGFNRFYGRYGVGTFDIQRRGLRILPFITSLTHAAAITGYLSTTSSLNFPEIAAGTTEELDVTVTGATADGNDIAWAAPAGQPETGIVWSAYVKSSNTVTVRAANVTGSPINPASRTWRVSVFKHG
jgi:hypothetical protein